MATMRRQERKAQHEAHEHKACACEVKVDRARRRIEGYLSVFDVVDRGGDIVAKGAFMRTLADDGGPPLPTPLPSKKPEQAGTPETLNDYECLRAFYGGTRWSNLEQVNDSSNIATKG